MAEGKLEDGDLFFTQMNSNLDPVNLPPSFFARGMNVLTRGGIVQCRPGYRCLFALPEGLLQGMAVFRPKIGPAVLVIGIMGLLYVSETPFKEFRQLLNVEFSSTARQLFFKQVEQSALTNIDGSITLITPRNLLIIQDGGLTTPVIFDGFSALHQSGTLKIPLGGPMEWVGGRLWVARGSQLFPSDLGNPLSFTEHLYVPGFESFFFSQTITALVKNPRLITGQLFVFTDESMSVIQAGVRDRSQWPATPNFQDIILPGVGCVSPRSVIAHYGMLFWFSRFGLMSMDAASQAFISSSLPYQDEAMSDSKSNLSSDLGGIACSAFENYLMVSVPHADILNRHTWVMDASPLKKPEPEPLQWNSYWTGTRPVEWVCETFQDETRSLYISTDYDGVNRLWEAWLPDRRDESCPITWFCESRGLTCNTPGKLKEFRYADVFVSELSGVVDFAVFWAGAHRGKYKRILTKRINATRGSIRAERTISIDNKVIAYKNQSRPLRTQDARAMLGGEILTSDGVESENLEFKDESFQLLFVGSGPGAVRGYVVYTERPKNDDDQGRVEEDEVDDRFVRFDGAASLDEESFDVDSPLYTSVRTVTLTQGDITETGMAEATSIISQQDADKISTCIAARKAADAIEEAAPKLVSQGVGV